ncbi:MAG TPA: AraC family transcriptional regulator [Rhizomicrobium sp.]|jgi:AraC-like DNA-binding protein
MKMNAPHRTIRAGREKLEHHQHVPRHLHVDAYATLVLAGAYEQFSYAGRLKAVAGDVLVQPSFDCHADRMLTRGIELIRLPWRYEPGFGGLYRNLRVDPILRAAERSVREAVMLLEEELALAACEPPATETWSDRLAIDLRLSPRLHIAPWAAALGLSREHVSRRFTADFGVTPSQYRSELNARRAWVAITETAGALSTIAADLGFADQAHMTRAVTAYTGMPPGRWRKAHSFKTAGAPDARLAE